MCIFVTIGVPASGALLQPLLDAGLSVARCGNRDLRRLFGEKVDAFEVTHGGCSCDLFRGRATPATRQRERYRAKGWSEAKIARALQSIAQSQRRSCQLEGFVSAVAAIAESTVSVLLFAHVYRGSTEGEPFDQLKREFISTAQFRTGKAFPVDTIVELSARM